MKKTSSTTILASLALPLAVASACGAPPLPPSPPPPEPPATAEPSDQPTATPEAASPAPVAQPTPTQPSTRWTGGFATPESVVYDPAGDRYLVSNIHGRPVDVDNNGFISELSPDGTIKNLKWIEAGKKGVKLDAPKGMAISGDLLYVADLDKVRTFSLKSGAPIGSIKLEGATFANGVAAGPDGKVYISDSGLKMNGRDFEPTGTDAVWVIAKNKASVLAKSTELGKPNGLAMDDKGLLVSTFGSGEVYRLGADGTRSDVQKPPKGALDGLVFFENSVFVSSWEGSSVYRKTGGGEFAPIVVGAKAPADFAIDTKRKLVIVPRFLDDAVEAYPIP
jgi:sugar lactone lactonase YvrE